MKESRTKWIYIVKTVRFLIEIVSWLFEVFRHVCELSSNKIGVSGHTLSMFGEKIDN